MVEAKREAIGLYVSVAGLAGIVVTPNDGCQLRGENAGRTTFGEARFLVLRRTVKGNDWEILHLSLPPTFDTFTVLIKRNIRASTRFGGLIFILTSVFTCNRVALRTRFA